MERREFIAATAAACAIGQTKGTENAPSESSLVLEQTMYWKKYEYKHASTGESLYHTEYCIKVKGKWEPYMVFFGIPSTSFFLALKNVSNIYSANKSKVQPGIVTMYLYTEHASDRVLIEEREPKAEHPMTIWINSTICVPLGLWRIPLFPLLKKHGKLYLEIQY